jgi:GcrA cell cycle regulator
MCVIYLGDIISMSWTDERVALLKKLWGEGKTAAEIAKNAVIGKAHRLKLSNRVSPIQQNKKTVAKQASTEDKKPAPRKRQPVTIAPAANSEKVSLAELKEKMCRWPIGDPQEEDFHFCGGVSVPGLPYCEDHCRVAYQAASRNRILQAEDFEEKSKDDDEIKEEAVA